MASSGSLGVRIVTQEEVLDRMNQIVSDVEDILQLPRAKISQLLHHFCWDKAAALEAISKDEKRIFQLVGLQDLNGEPVANTVSKIGVSVSCEICYSDITEDSAVEDCPSCNHPFCRACWVQYLTTQITANDKTLGLECPMTNCGSLVEELFISQILSNNEPHILSKYKSLLCTSFVQKNENLSWCPSCNQLVELLRPGTSQVTCQCGHQFCFHCGRPDHFIVPCFLMEDWEGQIFRNSKQSVITVVKSKKCPGCRMDIERISGCTHMSCSRCKSQFCWNCLELWNGTHGNCNRVEEDKTEVEEEIIGGLTESQRFKIFLAVFNIKKEYLGCVNLNEETIYYIEHLTPISKSLPIRWTKSSEPDFSNIGLSSSDDNEDKFIEEGILLMNQFFSGLPFSIHMADVVAAIEEEMHHKLRWFPIEILTKAVEMIQKIQHITIYSQIFAFYLGCHPLFEGVPHPDMQDLRRFDVFREAPQKIKIAATIESLLTNLEEANKILSILVLDLFTGFLALLCCKSKTESADVLANFHENVESTQGEVIRLLDLCHKRKTIVCEFLEKETSEQKFLVRTRNH
eukprot:GFUD01007690.1.p1 GENE.GFUD01007690.1~~GFUD01007690.1.p1  ORF type:complete len:573 (-),score=128.10 GFUD01007690.1:278-1996(-)